MSETKSFAELLESKVFIEEKPICAALGITRVTLRLWVAQGRFPTAYKIGTRRIAWKSQEVKEAIDGFAKVDFKNLFPKTKGICDAAV